ncbi:hypothetical protein MMC29_005891, partial [Sticta canariensis]|nr:hypothetical protein [Sticta canariensis]
TCFVLNLAFNALMWVLFTAALTRTSSTTRAAIINTSANFMLTALLGFAIFGERLPPLWWLGAGSLVVGNVIIGRRQEDGDEGGVSGARNGRSAESEGGRNERYRDQGDGAISDGVEMDVKEVTGNGQREGETFKDQEEVDFERRRVK